MAQNGAELRRISQNKRARNCTYLNFTCVGDPVNEGSLKVNIYLFTLQRFGPII